LKAQLVPEVDVLIGVAKWLHLNGWQLEKISPRGLDDEKKIRIELTTTGISIENIKFHHAGEDIRARQGSNLWKIECKSLSDARSQTDRTNFDRAVASTVSYFTQTEGLRLGIALPEWYKAFCKSKLPQALRLAINLWIFLYVDIDEVYEFAPDEEIPEGD